MDSWGLITHDRFTYTYHHGMRSYEALVMPGVTVAEEIDIGCIILHPTISLLRQLL